MGKLNEYIRIARKAGGAPTLKGVIIGEKIDSPLERKRRRKARKKNKIAAMSRRKNH